MLLFWVAAGGSGIVSPVHGDSGLGRGSAESVARDTDICPQDKGWPVPAVVQIARAGAP